MVRSKATKLRSFGNFGTGGGIVTTSPTVTIFSLLHAAAVTPYALCCQRTFLFRQQNLSFASKLRKVAAFCVWNRRIRCCHLESLTSKASSVNPKNTWIVWRDWCYGLRKKKRSVLRIRNNCKTLCQARKSWKSPSSLKIGTLIVA